MKIKNIVLVLTLILVATGLAFDMQWLKVSNRFITKNSFLLAPIGYAIYVIYDIVRGRK